LRAEVLEAAEEDASETSSARPPLVAIALLATAAVLALALLVQHPSRRSGVSLGGDPIEALREEAATDGLRAALEVHRWARGAYPDTLEALEPENALLAAVPLDRYSYARSPEGGFTLWRIRP
jgi:hypothetical protein